MTGAFTTKSWRHAKIGVLSAISILASSSAVGQDCSAEIELYIIDPCIMHFAAKTARETDMSVDESFGILKILGSSNFDELRRVTLPIGRTMDFNQRHVIYEFARNRCINASSTN